MSVSTSAPHDLLYSTAGQIARVVTAGEASAREVVEAHINRVEEVDARINALVVRRFDAARREADEIDRARSRGQRLGPLAGVPLSVKECFHLSGTQSTIGIGRYAGRISNCDSPLVTRLREAGAIVLGKTNIPQGMVMHETDNPVYGRTNNPWNLDRGPGGSSGGEGAAVAAGYSVIGLGNDIGGSIRQPAHSCGVFGLKPTTWRLTNTGTFENLRGLEALGVQAGPLARSADDIRLAYEILAAPGLSAIDWQVPPVPAEAEGRRGVEGLRIGYWVDDGFFRPCPAVRRAVEEAAQALRDAGASAEPFTPPAVERAMELYFGLLSADGGADLIELLGDSELDWRVKRLVRVGKAAGFVRGAAYRVLRALGQRHLELLMKSTGRCSGDRLWRLNYERRNYVQQFMDRMQAERFDALLSPPHALPALTHGASTYLNTAASYCMLVNLLACPAGIVPVTRVRPGEESDRPPSRDLAEKAARTVEQHSAGLPIGVQAIAPHWREDLVLDVMQAIEQGLAGKDDVPRRPPL